MRSIEIYINNIGNSITIFIDTKINKMIINDHEKSIKEEQKGKLLRIIRTWNKNYENESKTIDQECFVINVNTDEGTYTIKGKGTYPPNYNSFKELIGELNG